MNIERNEPIRFHEKGTLEAVTRWMASHHDGIAEWFKPLSPLQGFVKPIGDFFTAIFVWLGKISLVNKAITLLIELVYLSRYIWAVLIPIYLLFRLDKTFFRLGPNLIHINFLSRLYVYCLNFKR